ncbi:MAG: histidine phosphatase family protein [Gammaproteobacteria bacterium]|nr:MAG: histidine phosphatase family protein [Gammaproteobacteria bacterium]
MPRIYLVRHGKAAAGWDGHPDPGLDPLGQTQSRIAADFLAPLGPLAIRSSPLARARETAAFLAEIWDVEPLIEPRMAEIPSPSEDLAERSAWLQKAMAGTWADLEPRYRQWRDTVLDCLREIEQDTVIFSHFIAINVAVGHVKGNDRIVCFRPDNASITQLTVHDGRLALAELGSEANTEVR